MRLSMQTRIFLLLAGLTTCVLGAVLVIIDARLTQVLEQKISDDFKERQSVFQKEESLRYDRLIESAGLISENSTFKANVALQDPPTVYFAVKEMALFAKVDLFIVTDRTGTVLAWLGKPDQHGEDLSGRPSVARALRDVPPDDSLQWPELWASGQELYQVATVPIYANAQTLLGTLTLGTRLTRVEALELRGNTQIDISFFLGPELLATSMDAFGPEDTARFYAEQLPRIREALRRKTASEPFRIRIHGKEMLASISPLGRGEPACYLACVPLALELKVLSDLQSSILAVALISLGITFLLAIVLGRMISRPVLHLVDAMARVRSGDLNVAVRPLTNDEIGLLAQSFNEMVVWLRERLQLMKYVGSYTREMIRNGSSQEASLGGERRELTVLFSDMRGFTSFSEHRPPEAVVAMLNHYLGFQAEIITRHQGSIDKFVGDEVVAVFSGPDSLRRAIGCAVEIQRRATREPLPDAPPIAIGIGINHGAMVLGNMGATDRMDYTVVGSAVNLGARLCSAAGPGEILICQDLLERLAPDVPTGNSRQMTFKGFSTPLHVSEVLHEHHS